MKPSDYLGFGVFFSFGFLLLLFPQGFIRFYTRRFGDKIKMPGTFGVRLSGGLWVALMLAVLISFLMKR